MRSDTRSGYDKTIKTKRGIYIYRKKERELEREIYSNVALAGPAKMKAERDTKRAAIVAARK